MYTRSSHPQSMTQAHKLHQEATSSMYLSQGSGSPDCPDAWKEEEIYKRGRTLIAAAKQKMPDVVTHRTSTGFGSSDGIPSDWKIWSRLETIIS